MTSCLKGFAPLRLTREVVFVLLPLFLRWWFSRVGHRVLLCWSSVFGSLPLRGVWLRWPNPFSIYPIVFEVPRAVKILAQHVCG